MEEFDIFFESDNDSDDEGGPLYRLPKRYIRDAENPLEFYTEVEFHKRYRFTKNCIIDVIFPIIAEDFEINNQRGLPVSPMLQLLIACRFYATNSFQVVHGDLRSFSQASVSRIIKKVSISFANRLGRFVKFPDNQNDAFRNTEEFFNVAHFPRVAGCVDGTHIAISNPGGPNAEVFRNRKGWFSMNVQVISGPSMEILDIVVRHPGSAHDSLVFNRSAVRARLQLIPFLHPQNIHEERYNRAHVATRNVVERLFGVWKRKFSCLHSGLRTSLNTSMAVVCATAVLYNIGLRHNQTDVLDDEIINENVPQPNLNDNAGAGIAFRRAFAHTYF